MAQESEEVTFEEALKRRQKEQDVPIRVVRGSGGDPALRLALINAGVISYQQLALAEEELRVAQATGQPAVANGVERPGVSEPGECVQQDS